MSPSIRILILISQFEILSVFLFQHLVITQIIKEQ
jgi:hypothetical protein